MMYNFANSSNGFSSAFPMFGVGVGLFTLGAILLFVLMILVIVLKGYALWHAAKRDEKGWFIVLLVVNTLGILELVYLYFVVEKWKTKKPISETPSPSTTTPPPTSSAQ